MSAGGQKVWLVCYDISDDKRRDKVYHLMRGAGDRLQYSVFRCALSDIQLAELKLKLDDEIDHFEDQVMFVPLGPAENPKSWTMFALGRPLAVPARTVRIV